MISSPQQSLLARGLLIIDVGLLIEYNALQNHVIVILLSFGWAFTKQVIYFLRLLMLYNSPLDSLSRDRHRAVIESKYPDLCAPPHPWSTAHVGLVFMH